MKGTIKFFNTTKGFGFIAADDGKEYFLHQSALAPGVTPKERDVITFDIVQGEKGLKAANAKIGSAAAAAHAAPAEEDESDDMSDDASDDEGDEEEQ